MMLFSCVLVILTGFQTEPHANDSQTMILNKFYIFEKLSSTQGVGRTITIIVLTGWERTGNMLCIVDTFLSSVLMALRMCLRELCCL